VKVFVFFLVASFVLGGSTVGARKPDRAWLVLGACVLVSAALYTYKFA
jgi:hypothetical protein